MKKLFMIAVMALLTVSAMAQSQRPQLNEADKIANAMENARNIGMGEDFDRMMELFRLVNTPGFNKRDSVEKIMMPLREKLLKIRDDYQQKHPETCLTAKMVNENKGRMTLEQLEEAYGKFDELALQTTSAKQIKDEIDRLKVISAGNMAPDFTRTNVEGKPFTLSSLRGKVVILDFWASWCQPCRRSNPHMKSLMEKYGKKGLQIVYIASDDSHEDRWKKAIEEDGLKGKNYHHILSGYQSDVNVSNLYAVHFLPTKFLVDKDGKMLGKMSDKDLDAKLQEIFGF